MDRETASDLYELKRQQLIDKMRAASEAYNAARDAYDRAHYHLHTSAAVTSELKNLAVLSVALVNARTVLDHAISAMEKAARSHRKHVSAG